MGFWISIGKVVMNLGYKVFNVQDKDKIPTRSGTDGYQPKFISDDGKHFIKVQARLEGAYADDYKVECIASDIGEQLGFFVEKQLPCRVNIKRRNGMVEQRYGAYADNFALGGVEFVSMIAIEEQLGIEVYSKLRMCGTIEKVELLSKTLSAYTGESMDTCRWYMLQMAIVDILVGNTDRHLRNIGAGYNAINGSRKLLPIFDFGMGLFEHDQYAKKHWNFQGNLDRVYIEPYGESPIDLINILGARYGIRQSCRDRVHGIRISDSKFPSRMALRYFKMMVKAF